MPFLDTLRDWQSFYVVTGGASAALIGLMFIAVSLGSHLVTDETMDNVRTYVNPPLFHFVVVFLISCIALVPAHSQASLSIAIGLISVVGLRQAVEVILRMRRVPTGENDEDSHWLWHGVLPLTSYALAGLVALGLAVTGFPDWLNGLAVVVLTLTVCSIRNTWLLVLWIARRRETS
jgi:hypothetical protein